MSKYFFAYSLLPLVVALSDIVFFVVFRYLKTFHIPQAQDIVLPYCGFCIADCQLLVIWEHNVDPRATNLPKILAQKTIKKA
jgi:hypothetical protein